MRGGALTTLTTLTGESHPWLTGDYTHCAHRGSPVVRRATDERTDVFSLGATLYAMAFYYSPFECTFQGNDQRVVECSHLRVIGGAQFPTEMEYSAEFKELIEWQVTRRSDAKSRVASCSHSTCGRVGVPCGQAASAGVT